MIRIILLCAGGLSTSFLVQNMIKVATARGLEVEIKARSERELGHYIRDVDVVLLAPQACYGESKIKEQCTKHGKGFATIPGLVYGTMNGQAALDLALSALPEKGE
jgi:PTS system cellobiose-specific IIB component